MSKANASNERIKWKYLRYLKEADGKSDASIDAVAKAICRFQDATKDRDFHLFHKELAIAFKKRLSEALNERTGKSLSKSTIDGTLRALREFFRWLAREPGYKSKLEHSDAHYFNLSAKDQEVARAKRPKRVATLDQLHKVLSAMPAQTDLEQRDQAVLAFAMLTGARNGALATLKLKHVDMDEGLINQDGREVSTKRSKTIQTWLFPVGGEALDIARNWVVKRLEEHLASPDDPLFPKTRVERDNEGYFRAMGLAKDGWANTQPIREIFKEAFERVGLAPVNPHSIRDTLAQFGMRKCPDIEAYKIWSMNLGHAGMLTTLTSYGEVPDHRRAEVMKALNQPQATAGAESTDRIEERLKRLEAIAAAKIGG